MIAFKIVELASCSTNSDGVIEPYCWQVISTHWRWGQTREGGRRWKMDCKQWWNPSKVSMFDVVVLNLLIRLGISHLTSELQAPFCTLLQGLGGLIVLFIALVPSSWHTREYSANHWTMQGLPPPPPKHPFFPFLRASILSFASCIIVKWPHSKYLNKECYSLPGCNLFINYICGWKSLNHIIPIMYH